MVSSAGPPHQYNSRIFSSANIPPPDSSSAQQEAPPKQRRGSATIVLLLGSSTAGKSTLCNKVISESAPQGLIHTANQSKSMVNFQIKLENKNWKVIEDSENRPNDNRTLILEDDQGQTKPLKISSDSQTITFDNEQINDDESISVLSLPWEITGTDTVIGELMDNYFLEKIQGSDFEPWFNETLERDEITCPRDIFSPVLNEKELIVPTPEGLKDFLLEQGWPKFSSEEQEHKVFDIAIENSMKGIPTLIDVVPLRAGNYVQEFGNYLREKGFTCPTMTIQVHLPLPKLQQRMVHRNETPSDIRDGLFPAEQYTRLYGLTNEEEHLGTLTRADAESFIEQFGHSSTEEQNTKLLQDLGFTDDLVQSVNMGPKSLSDILVNTETEESSLAIAKDIVQRSTVQSFMQNEPHPDIRPLINVEEALE